MGDQIGFASRTLMHYREPRCISGSSSSGQLAAAHKGWISDNYVKTSNYLPAAVSREYLREFQFPMEWHNSLRTGPEFLHGGIDLGVHINPALAQARLQNVEIRSSPRESAFRLFRGEESGNNCISYHTRQRKG